MTAVVSVVTTLERGGAQKVAIALASKLHDEGRPHYLVTGKRSTQPSTLDDEAESLLSDRLIRLPSLVHPIHPVYDALALHDLTRVIDVIAKRHRTPLLVHSHQSKAGVVARLVARSLPYVRSVHTVHGYGTYADGAFRRSGLEFAERVAGRAADVTVYVSSYDEELGRSQRYIKNTRSEIIRAGISTKHFVPATALDKQRARKRFGLRDDDVVVSVVANLKPQKDPIFHVDILHALLKREPHAKLLFVGDGPLRNSATEHARALGIDKSLLLPGFVDDPLDVYHAADVYLLASAFEGLPCSVLEALSTRLVCVVRDSGFAKDLAFSKNVFALSHDATPDAFSDTLISALRAKARKAPLPREFTDVGMLEDYERLYDELIGAPRPRDYAPLRRRR